MNTELKFCLYFNWEMLANVLNPFMKLIVFKWIKQSSSGNLRLTLIFKDQVHSQILYIRIPMPKTKQLIRLNFKWSLIKSTLIEPGSTKTNSSLLFPARKMKQHQKRIHLACNQRKREEVLKQPQLNIPSILLPKEQFVSIRLLGFIQSLENRIWK